MNNTEAGELLRQRRKLTGGTYNDDTVAAWQQALAPWPYEQCRDALVDAARTEKRVTVAHVVELLPATKHVRNDRHSVACICSGRGWVEVEQSNGRGNTWHAWDRCPNGPRTGFHEVDA